MTTHVRNITFDSGDDTRLRAWIADVRASLLAVGLVRTADTGQIDTATVGRNLGYDSTGQEWFLGFDMFRFTDALQASRPVFIRVEYWQPVDYNTWSGYMCSIASSLKVQVGNATNGAGALNGTVTSNLIRWQGGRGMGYYAPSTYRQDSYVSGSSPCYFFGDGSTIAACLGATSGAQPLYAPFYYTTPNRFAHLPGTLLIERTRNLDGTPNGKGVAIMGSTYWVQNSNVSPPNPVPTFQMLSFTGSGASAIDTAGWPGSWPGQGFGSGTSGPDLSIWPLSVATPAAANVLGMLGIYKGDLGHGSEIDLTVLGATRRYKSLANIGGASSQDNSRSSTNTRVPSSAMLMRWDP